MAEYLDFLYIRGVIETSFQFYFMAKILKKRIWPPFYFLLAVCTVIAVRFLAASTIIRFIALVFLLTVFGGACLHADFKSSLLYAALTTEIMLLCYGVVNSLISLLCPFLFDAFHDTAGIAVMLASEAASLALTGFCYYMVYRYFSGDALYPSGTTAEMQQMFLVFIPILTIFIMGEYINTIGFEFQYMVVEEEGYFRYLFSHWQLFAMHLLGLASLFCLLIGYKKLLQGFRLRTELTLLEQEEHSLNQYVEEAKTRYDKTKSFRHDIKNHLSVLNGLLTSGKSEEAASYLQSLSIASDSLSFPFQTGNSAADILLSEKLALAEADGIATEVSLVLPDSWGIDDFDLCVIFANALDNAIEYEVQIADPAKRLIHVTVSSRRDFVLLRFENYCQDSLRFREGLPVTTKKDKSNHGYGLKSIRFVAEKYGGIVTVKQEREWFVLQVLLPIRGNIQK